MSTPADKRVAASPVVVVGVDGSPNSVKALRAAIEEANWRGASVRAINAWQFPSMYGMQGAVYVVDGTELEKAGASVLEEAIAQATTNPATRTSIERVVQVGSAAELLVIESKTAELVVVGARGHGGFIGLLLGSVSTQVAKHAHCPVLVVPPDEETEASPS